MSSFVDESHPECKFCKKQFDDVDESQKDQFKKNLLKKNKNNDKPVAAENKEEEFFKMTLLSFQLTHKSNRKIMALDAKKLFLQVSEKEKLPFFKWHDYLQKTVEKLMFENMYKKKTEVEYTKLLAKKFEV